MSIAAHARRTALLVALMVIAAGCSGGGSGGGGAPTDERIVLVRDQRLLLRAADGKERELFRPAASNVFPAFPAWSPDGARIAFVQSTFALTRDGDWGDAIYVIDSAGGDPRVVWTHAVRGQQIRGLTWTVDGIALIAGVATPQASGSGAPPLSIQRIDRATGASSQIVDGAIEPLLSRDGTRLVYLVPGVSGAATIWVAAADGSDAHPVPLPSDLDAPFAPRVSPDGESIAFAAPTRGAFSAQPEGRSRWLTSAVAPPRGGAVPPAPRASGATHGVPMELWHLDIAAGTLATLTNFGEDDPRGAWEPDGTALIVIGTGGLYRVPTDGQDIERLDDGAFAGQLDVR